MKYAVKPPSTKLCDVDPGGSRPRRGFLHFSPGGAL